MPFTAFHVGPALLIYSLFLFLDPFALIFGSTFPDLEGLIYFFIGGTTPHGPLHSIIGSTLLALFVVTPASIACWKIITRTFPKTREPKTKIVVASSLVAVYSHLFLDSLLPAVFYGDVNLVWPFGYWAPLLDSVSPEQMYLFCVASFFVGVAMILVRTTLRKERGGRRF